LSLILLSALLSALRN